MAIDRESRTQSRWTRGEKCILAHVVATSVCVAAVLIVYLVHIGVVRHSGLDAFRITRRVAQSEKARAECVGAVWAGQRAACNALLVRSRWSLSVARCVAARAHPDLSSLLPYWSVSYSNGHRSDITRGVIHPRYEVDQLSNDMGLFEHATDSALESQPLTLQCSLPTDTIADRDLVQMTNIVIVKWDNSTKGGQCAGVMLNMSACARAMAELGLTRGEGEACVKPLKPCELSSEMAGAAIFVRGKLFGITPQADVGDLVPLLLLQLAQYKTWIDTVTSL